MIERHWKGIAKREKANDYIAHLQNDTFKKLGTIHGFVSATILKRELKDAVEFLIITKWETLEAIKQFAGAEVDAAVVPKLVQDMMLKYDNNVSHYEVVLKTNEP